MNSGGLNYGLVLISILVLSIPSWRYYWPERLWAHINNKFSLKPKYNTIVWLISIVIAIVFIKLTLSILAVNIVIQTNLISIYSGVVVAFAPRKELTEGGLVGLFINRSNRY